MRKKRIRVSLIPMTLCIYLRWGRGVSARNIILSSRDGKRMEHVVTVANELYIGDKEAFVGDTIETRINSEFHNTRFSYDMGYPVGIIMDIYANDTAGRLGLRCYGVRYAQTEEDRCRYNVKDDKERLVMMAK